MAEPISHTAFAWDKAGRCLVGDASSMKGHVCPHTGHIIVIGKTGRPMAFKFDNAVREDGDVVEFIFIPVFPRDKELVNSLRLFND